MSIRENFKEREDDRTLLQTRIPSDLMRLVDAQIDRDKRNGFDVDRTIVVTECLKHYIRESSKPQPKKRRAG